MKRPDLVVLIVVWEFLSAVIALIPIVFLCGMLLGGGFSQWGMMGGWGWWNYGTMMPGWMGSMMAVVWWVLLLLLVVYLVLAVLGGMWLLKGKEMGRLLSIVHAALSLLFIPVGTVIGTLILVYLTRPNVIEYFQPPKPPQG